MKELSKKNLKTLNHIVDAYIDLMQTKDFDKISVKSIVEKADISRGTFYLYFTDIYDLMNGIEDYIITNMPFPSAKHSTAIFKPGTPPSAELCNNNEWAREWFEYYTQYSRCINTLLGPHGDALFHVRLKKYIKTALKVSMDNDNMPDDNMRTYFLDFFPNLYLMLAKQWTTDKTDPISIDQVIDIISTIRIGAMYKQYLDSVK